MRKRSVSHSIVVASVASLTALYRKFKHPFSDGSYIAEPVSRQSHLYLVKNRGFTWITRAMQRSEALDLFPVGALSLKLRPGGIGCQAVWNRSTRRAVERGGARVGKPGWVRTLRNADPVANRRTGLIIGCAKEGSS